jgi:cyclopropane fatty-acyl-phospholipid synthase-like methyltransferase
MMTLWSDVLHHNKRLIHKWKHYFPIYERHFKEFVYKPVTLIEIGCGAGGSLQMWKQYFGPNARIVGIDINAQCKRFAEDQIEIHIGPQQDAAFLQRVIDRVGIPDIVIDDGSHVMSHIVATFNFLYPRMLKNGVYLVEDLHTAYWDEFEGGLRRPATFVEVCKNLIDELNADHSRGALPPTDFTKSTVGMHFYDSVVVFERGAYTRKCAPQWGGTFEKMAERAKIKLGRGHRAVTFLPEP